MKNLLLTSILVTILTGCGSMYGDKGDAGATGSTGATGDTGATGADGAAGPQGNPGADAPTTTSTTTQPDNPVQDVVDRENLYRDSVGQESLIPGLSCSLYTVPNTTTLIIGATGLVGIGTWTYYNGFNQPNNNASSGLNVLPLVLQPVFTSWYIVKCNGTLVMATSAWHEFDLTSDDGSDLYVDGLLVNNDGIHAAATKSGVRYLKYGLHSFELDFLQGAGLQQLQLNMDGTLMGSSSFYH